MPFLVAILSVMVIGSLVYCALIVPAASRYLAVKSGPCAALPPITIMKPLSGMDEGLAENLRSFFNQDYPEFEVIFAVRNLDDPAALVARKIIEEFPSITASVVVAGESPIPNAKVFSLRRMFEMARYEVVVMADSDTRVNPAFLTTIAAEMSDDEVGLVTCPYRAIPGKSFWSEL
ncbi:MAG TPA: glycosyltransferase, partial [Blastocatellia bacterium]|nr:glycosyltransferase [Blastocatellia bacterium]